MYRNTPNNSLFLPVTTFTLVPIPPTPTLLMAARAVPHSLPTDVVDFLKSGGFDTADLPLILNLLSAAQALAESPAFKAMKAEQHCVRCHGTFTDQSNGSSECLIPHVFDTEPQFTGEVGEDKIYQYTSKCCPSEMKLEKESAGNLNYRNLDDLGYCYEGYHTADVDEVEEEEDYNGVNVRRCKLDEETKACTLECINDSDEPVWDWQVPK